MKKLFFVIVMLLTISFNANSQDKIIKKNTATERAPVNTFGTDNQNPNTIQSYGSRWFGQNAGASSFFAKGFLNSAAAVNNFGPSSADLYGAMELLYRCGCRISSSDSRYGYRSFDSTWQYYRHWFGAGFRNVI